MKGPHVRPVSTLGYLLLLHSALSWLQSPIASFEPGLSVLPSAFSTSLTVHLLKQPNCWLRSHPSPIIRSRGPYKLPMSGWPTFPLMVAFWFTRSHLQAHTSGYFPSTQAVPLMKEPHSSSDLDPQTASSPTRAHGPLTTLAENLSSLRALCLTTHWAGGLQGLL